MAIQKNTNLVAIVDDDDLMRSALQGMLKSVGVPSQAFASAEEFLMSDRGYPDAGDVRPGVAGQAER
jgi:FixJ family two-component response regulator